MTDIVAASSLSPANKHAEKTLAIRLFGVSDIPVAMRKMNWNVAADLMQYWFDGKPDHFLLFTAQSGSCHGLQRAGRSVERCRDSSA